MSEEELPPIKCDFCGRAFCWRLSPNKIAKHIAEEMTKKYGKSREDKQ